MDNLDAKIINILQDNARIPLKQLAEQVFLSSPAVSARIAKLEQEGYIGGYSATVNLEKLNYHVTAFINMELNPKQKSAFYPFVDSCPNVLECNCVTGHYSILLKVAFPSTQKLDVFIGKLQEYGSTETQIVFSTPVNHRGVLLPVE